MRDIPTPEGLVLPEGTTRQPHGEVVDAGPECKFAKIGDLVCFLPDNLIGFDGVQQFIIPETSVFAFYVEDEAEATI